MTRAALMLAALLTLSGCALGATPFHGRIGPNADAARMRYAGAEPGAVWDRSAPDVDAYLTETAENDLFQAQAAQVAAERTQNRHVRAYARRMMRHHSHFTERAARRAELAGLTPPASVTLDEGRAEMIRQLQTTGDVDRLYIAQQRRTHLREWTAHTGYLRQGDVQRLRREAGWQRKYNLRHIRQLDRLERRALRP